MRRIRVLLRCPSLWRYRDELLLPFIPEFLITILFGVIVVFATISYGKPKAPKEVRVRIDNVLVGFHSPTKYILLSYDGNKWQHQKITTNHVQTDCIVRDVAQGDTSWIVIYDAEQKNGSSIRRIEIHLPLSDAMKNTFGIPECLKKN